MLRILHVALLQTGQVADLIGGIGERQVASMIRQHGLGLREGEPLHIERALDHQLRGLAVEIHIGDAVAEHVVLPDDAAGAR